MADKSEKITENAVSKAMAPSLASLKNIEAGITKLNAQGNQGAEERIEGVRAEKKSASNEEKTVGLLGGILKSLGLKEQKDKADKKKSGGLLSLISKVVGFGMLGLSTTFFGAFGVLAGTIKAVIDSPAFSVVKGLFKIGNKIFSPFLNMFKGLGGIGKAATALMENPTVIKVMEKTSKFLKPFMRIASWLFMGWEFFKGWKNADKIFGKGEGDATIFEKFAAGLGGVISFLTFDLIPLETAAKSLKDTFDFLVLAWKEPGVAWAKVKQWWIDFSFDESIVKPMVKMFDDFPKKVKEFIDGPLSTFGDKSLKMVKTFIFGKDDPETGKGTGGLWGAVKSLFTAENIRKAIEGMVKISAGFVKMLSKLALMPIFGTGEWKILDPSTWGGLMGGIYNLFAGTTQNDVDNIGIKGGEFISSVSGFLKDIFWHDDGKSGLLQKAMAWFQEQLDKFNVVDVIKGGIKNVSSWLTGGDDEPAPTKPTAMVNSRKKPIVTPAGPRSVPKELGAGLSVPKTDIDWDFISQKEGGSKTDGYVPNPEGSKSGVTIATGFDLGARDIKGLAGLPSSLKSRLAPYLGLQGIYAKKFLDKNPLVIKKSEAKLIDMLSKGQMVSKLKKEWNKNAAIMKTPMFEDLTGAQKTIAASVAFQYGSLAKAPKFRAAAQEGRWDDVQGELRNFGDDYGSRRTSEANYLMANRPNNSGRTLNELQMANADGKSGGGGMTVNSAPQTTNVTSNGTTVVQMTPSAHNGKAKELFG
jgi:hypothetical protein